MDFSIVSDFVPTGDQPEAIKQLEQSVRSGSEFQTLLGVTGSGKTFTVANLIERVQRPTLVLSHNKTLAAQLYSEFREFFPDNAVEYFVSYYDYYQPEAYLPVTDTYIEKDLSINEEIEKLRLSTTSSLLSGRRDVIVVSSVSCLYGIGNPDDFHSNTIKLEKNQVINRNQLLRRLVDSLYSRSEIEFRRGNFRVKGDTVDIFLAYGDIAYRVVFWGDEIEEINSLDPLTGLVTGNFDQVVIYPANIFVTTRERMNQAIRNIQDDLFLRLKYFNDQGMKQEAQRLQQKVEYDLEMIKELGYCSGIENYSRYFDGRSEGTRPFCLLDYFPDDFLTVIDESHVTLPQVRAMYGGDFSRKKTLVDFGFRLPAAIDNRPLKFEEFEALSGQKVFVSATPGDYELEKCEGIIIEQVIRPTGLPEPKIEIRPTENQIDDLISEIEVRTKRNERILVTTLTKRMAEELSKYLTRLDIRCRYIHSDIDTLERVEILEGLREGEFDVLIGVNLLREGLDLPEVSLVAILDADKEGFLRSSRSLTQTSGRAARNINGMVIMYADIITRSMKQSIDETTARRTKQLAYNKKHKITPAQITRTKRSSLQKNRKYTEPEEINVAADPVIRYMGKDALKKTMEKTRSAMEKAASELDFMTAARYRDELKELEKIFKK
ncbi:MAG: excinuclease ABC subunit UvrB [bacterium]